VSFTITIRTEEVVGRGDDRKSRGSLVGSPSWHEFFDYSTEPNTKRNPCQATDKTGPAGRPRRGHRNRRHRPCSPGEVDPRQGPEQGRPPPRRRSSPGAGEEREAVLPVPRKPA